MLTYTGKYNTAIVFVDEIDETTVAQIYTFLNHPAFANTKIRIMPDTHAGAGAVIGFTCVVTVYIIPNVVGVDIGCGIDAYRLKVGSVDFEQLDKFIRKYIPSGFAHQSKPVVKAQGEFFERLQEVCSHTEQGFEGVVGQLGTLGGGNHFIEVDKDEDSFWLTIHSGSRNFGLRVANFHQKKAKTLMNEEFDGADAYKGLEYLPMDKGGKEYLEDMKVAQEFALLNRQLMATCIMDSFFNAQPTEQVSSVHNYINFKDNIIRKGAISAYKGERLIIPLNMKDGVIIGRGKGNEDWNFSAPHGAGRILSRRKAKDTLSVDVFKEQMEGIWTSCICQETLDESPMVYKDRDLILDAIKDSVEVEKVLLPVYNFKAGGE